MLLLIVMAVVSGVSLSCSSDEFDLPTEQKTMARRKAQNTMDYIDDPISHQSYMEIPVEENECALWSLTKLKINSGGNFSEQNTVRDYYYALRERAVQKGWGRNSSMSSSTLLILGREEVVLNNVYSFANDTINRDSVVRVKINEETPKLIGINGHIGVYTSKTKKNIYYEDASGYNHYVPYSDILEFFY